MAISNAILQPYIFHILRKHNHRGWEKLHVLRRYPIDGVTQAEDKAVGYNDNRHEGEEYLWKCMSQEKQNR